MNTNEELEKLIQQKYEIEQQIRRIKNQKNEIAYGDAKFQIQKYPTGRPDDYVIMLRNPCNQPEYRHVWRSAIRSTNKEECINAIDSIIYDLTVLKQRIEGNDNDVNIQEKEENNK